MKEALGLIEAKGYTTAVSALDAASKAADVALVGMDKIVGMEGGVGVNVQIAGEVAAVEAAIEAAVEAGNRVGMIYSSKVIPGPHGELDKLIRKFEQNLNSGGNKKGEKKSTTKTKTAVKKSNRSQAKDKLKETKKK